MLFTCKASCVAVGRVSGAPGGGGPGRGWVLGIFGERRVLVLGSLWVGRVWAARAWRGHCYQGVWVSSTQPELLITKK